MKLKRARRRCERPGSGTTKRNPRRYATANCKMRKADPNHKPSIRPSSPAQRPRTAARCAALNDGKTAAVGGAKVCAQGVYAKSGEGSRYDDRCAACAAQRAQARCVQESAGARSSARCAWRARCGEVRAVVKCCQRKWQAMRSARRSARAAVCMCIFGTGPHQ